MDGANNPRATFLNLCIYMLIFIIYLMVVNNMVSSSLHEHCKFSVGMGVK